MSITVGNRPNVDCLSDGTEIFSERIGPPYDGVITLENFCELSGITINGIVPERTDMMNFVKKYGHCSDLSGKVTFYNTWSGSSIKTQVDFLKALQQQIQNIYLFQKIYEKDKDDYNLNLKAVDYFDDPNNICSSSIYAIVGRKIEATKLQAAFEKAHNFRTLFPDHLFIRIETSGFRYPQRNNNMDDAGYIKKALNIDILVAGQTEECLMGNFSIHTEFNNSNCGKFTVMKQLDELVNEFYPIHELISYDLLTKKEKTDSNRLLSLDKEISKWINQSNNRYLSFTNEGDMNNPHYFGQVPRIPII